MDGGKEGGAVLALPAFAHQLQIELLREGQVLVDDLHEVAGAGGCFYAVRCRNLDFLFGRRFILLRVNFFSHVFFNFYYLIKFRILILTLKLI